MYYTEISLILFLFTLISIRYHNTKYPKSSTFPNHSHKNQSIIFLKTHKTGSSVLTSIFLRKCVEERLNCFIPNQDAPGKTYDLDRDYVSITKGRGTFEHLLNASNYPILNKHNMIFTFLLKGSYGGSYPYDVWCHHVKFHKRLPMVVKNYPPPRETYFVSIVRYSFINSFIYVYVYV